MSELKAYCPYANRDGFYHKSEADKVIAEKDAEIAELKDKVREQTSIAEEGWKEFGIHHTSYAEAVKELYDKNKEIAELKEQVHDYAQGLYVMQAMAEKEARRHKYKRCLAMARIAQDDWHLHNSFYAMGHREFEKRKCEFYEKWRKRWLELAEKFKLNSTAQ